MAIIPSKITPIKPRSPRLKGKAWAMTRIVNAHRRKVLSHFPKARFETQFVVGLTIDEWGDYIETMIQAGMKWDDYGKTWNLVCVRKASDLDIATAEGFYAYYRYDNFRPQWARAKGFVADPANASPLDRDGDQV